MAVPAKLTLPLAALTFTTTARSDGSFAIPVSLPTDGTYTLTARGLTSGHTVTKVLTVGGASGSGTTADTNGGTPTDDNGGTTTSAGLADTGADTNLVLWSLVGGTALAAGVTSVVVVRRRAKAGSTE